MNYIFSLIITWDNNGLISLICLCYYFVFQRRCVLEEALRTRPEKSHGREMTQLMKEFKLPPLSLHKWLHLPRVFSRRNAIFSMPIDRRDLDGIFIHNSLETLLWLCFYITCIINCILFVVFSCLGLTPMQYVSEYIIVSSSKQLLYQTVLEQFNTSSYTMPLNVSIFIIILTQTCYILSKICSNSDLLSFINVFSASKKLC